MARNDREVDHEYLKLNVDALPLQNPAQLLALSGDAFDCALHLAEQPLHIVDKAG
jgi:hypothetical protein